MVGNRPTSLYTARAFDSANRRTGRTNSGNLQPENRICPCCPPLPLPRQLIESRLKNGGRALDGTAGNGRDTLFLAQLAGGNGKVWAFDIQAQALSNTAGLLRENGVEDKWN